MKPELSQLTRISKSWLVALVLLAVPAETRASVLNCTYDEAGRLVSVQYDALTNLVHHYDQSGGIGQVTTFNGAAADVAVTESTIPATPLVSVPFKVIVTAANLTANRATGVRLSSQFPAGHTLLSAISTIGTCSINGSALTCDIGNLDGGKVAVVTVAVSAGAPGEVTHTFNVASDGDPNLINNSSSKALAVLGPPALSFRIDPSEGAPDEIAWSALAEGLRLEETTSLAPPVVWNALDQGSLFGDRFAVPVVSNTGNRFFRLRSPD
jgi:hypothetical protein